MSAVLADLHIAPQVLGDTPGLVRDDEEHIYRYQGRIVPGITRMMEPIHSYDGVPEWILERKAELGTYVHLACELYDLGTLAEEELHQDIVPYLAAWKDFRRQYGGRMHAVEPKLYHHSLGFAGQPDRCMQVETPYDVVEIKTTHRLYDAVGVQLMAQTILLEHSMPGTRIGKRFAIQLKDNGKYVLKQFKDPHDRPTFIALLTVGNWLINHAGK